LNRPLDDDGEYYERRADPNRADREISLGTATILGIFFGLAVVCACFFGFGYTMGHNSARAAEAAVAVNPASGVTVAGAAKPAAGSLVPRAAAPSAQVAEDAGAGATPQSDSPQTTTVAVPSAAAKSAVAASDRVIAGDKVPVAVGGSQVAGSYTVQVAAVSSQDVADILLASLEKKGYTVAVRHEAQDKLLHVQIGPFADRKAAEAMQKRVLGDGFNAIVK
jgi:cell division septation protein DedD